MIVTGSAIESLESSIDIEYSIVNYLNKIELILTLIFVLLLCEFIYRKIAVFKGW